MKVIKTEEAGLFRIEGEPSVEKLMEATDQEFGAFVAGALGQFEMSHGRYAFNNAASSQVSRGEIPNYIITPLKEKNTILLYVPEVETFIGACLYAQKQFEKTGKIDAVSRERVVTEFMRDELRTMETAMQGQERADFCEGYMLHTQEKLEKLRAPKQSQPEMNITYTFKPDFPSP